MDLRVDYFWVEEYGVEVFRWIMFLLSADVIFFNINCGCCELNSWYCEFINCCVFERRCGLWRLNFYTLIVEACALNLQVICKPSNLKWFELTTDTKQAYFAKKKKKIKTDFCASFVWNCKMMHFLSLESFLCVEHEHREFPFRAHWSWWTLFSQCGVSRRWFTLKSLQIIIQVKKMLLWWKMSINNRVWLHTITPELK